MTQTVATGSVRKRWQPVSWLPPMGIALVCAVVSFFTIDRPVGAYFGDHPLQGLFADLLDAAEHVGTPYGQLLVLLAIVGVRHWREPRVWRVFAGASVAGLAANVIKLLVARVRPRAFDFEAASLIDGFVEWFPLGQGGSGIQSFPSAHTASAFGFAAMMTWLYPSGRLVFIIMASLTGLQRICCGAHFPSDVFIGAAVGWIVGNWMTRPHPVDRFFTRIEETWRNEEPMNS